MQIKQLTANGQLINCVNCHSGQVSVFRATTHSAIQPYINALSGMPGPEKFIIETDCEPYLPHQNNLIGFGERYTASDGIVEEYLLKHSIPAKQLQSVLLSYGLENCKIKECHKLSKCEERRLRILSAVYQPDKILIINDPFNHISSEWREPFAQLIVNFARSNSQIVLIPHLSYRPECWIDNDAIARIQVGESIQKTIGFTSQATNVQDMIKQIREDFNVSKNHEIKNTASEEQQESQSLEQVTDIRNHAWEEHSDIKTQNSPVTYSLYNTSWFLRYKNQIAASGLAFLLLFLFFAYKDSTRNAELSFNKPKPENNVLSTAISRKK